jgi:hypothetical protein
VIRAIAVASALAACSSNGRVWTAGGGVVCVRAADTHDLEAGRQRPAADAIPGCLTAPDHQVVKSTIAGWCGPCGFQLERAATTRERAARPDACCYSVDSPPPPPPP